MEERREQMVEELRKEEQARDLLSEVEERLRGENPELEGQLTRLERLAGSWPEGNMARLLIESAVGSARAHDAIKASADVSRSRSALEGEISTLRGVLSRDIAKSDIPD